MNTGEKRVNAIRTALLQFCKEQALCVNINLSQLNLS